ncbi:MAG: crotonase/enoyl-CoA hydratase family protein [Pseudomonadales bacterium]|jgi:enoyl-CoA hydratase/carnithine racemase|nr:crotonase/enoyl-CoA hydratase family protein [Pseudomonadales bacterium]
MNDLVEVTIEAGVADVRLNRPDKYNALSPDMFDAIVAAGERLGREAGVRAVVLSGNGRGFCAGLDFSSFQGMADRGGAEAATGAAATGALARDSERPENRAQRPAYVWKRLPVPVICALHGVAYGGGLQVALGADIRLAAPDARLSVMEIKWGLVPDMSLTQTLRDLVRLDVAKELTFTGRVLGAEEAQRLGLVTRVVEDPLAAALDMARQIAGKSPDAIRFGKKLLEESWHADPATGLGLEASLQASLIGSPNQLEAVKANFEDRAPRFADPAA